MAKNENYRPGWDDYFMAIARVVATRSTCDRLRAGAVLVKDNRIISTGYNGSPPGLPHCDDVGHMMEEGHCVRTIHGEHNAILQAAVVPGSSTDGSTLYTKFIPCIHCCKYVVAAGVKRVVYAKIYRNSKAPDYLREAGVEVDRYGDNKAWNAEVRKIFADEIEEVKAAEGDVVIKDTQS